MKIPVVPLTIDSLPAVRILKFGVAAVAVNVIATLRHPLLNSVELGVIPAPTDDAVPVAMLKVASPKEVFKITELLSDAFAKTLNVCTAAVVVTPLKTPPAVKPSTNLSAVVVPLGAAVAFAVTLPSDLVQ